MLATIYTVGHSTRAIEEFLALLHEAAVRLLIDVRRFPGSRRYPQFGREPLEAALAASGIAYRHEPELGGRRRPARDSPNTAWRNDAFRGYADHMASREFSAALDRLTAAAEQQATVILCAEAVPWRCHRRLIADALLCRGHSVLHILAAGRADPHELHPNARRRADGTLIYPADGEQLIL